MSSGTAHPSAAVGVPISDSREAAGRSSAKARDAVIYTSSNSLSKSVAAESKGELPLGEASDEVLILRVRDGDETALAMLFRRYARAVRKIACKVLRDPFEADDLAQEIFLLVYRKCGGFDSSKGSVSIWILQMAYRRAISRRRYLTCRHFYSSVEIENAEQTLPDRDMVAGFEDAIDRAWGKSEVQTLLASLSDNQCRTLRLYFFEGYTLEEIATELGQSKDNVRHHYFRGLDKLRKQIFRGAPRV